MFYNESAPNCLRLLVDEIMDSWRIPGSHPDALAALQEHPQLRQQHSLSIDLAYDEYCLRQESGEALDPQEFCGKFSHVGQSLARMLGVHRVMQVAAPDLAESAKKIEWPAAGTQWLDWQLQEEIGSGRFSRVFLATEPALGNRQVVIKCATSGGPDEAYLLGKLEHPQIMKIHTVRHDEERNLVAICMPFAGKMTLAEALDRVQSGDAETVPSGAGLRQAIANAGDKDAYSLAVTRLIEKLARGLQFAHGAGVLHGDIKPPNILLSTAGEPLLVDFNLSADQSRDESRFGGTPPYMAPERLEILFCHENASQVTPDFRSDVFSLGVVFYELLYGQIPYEFEVDDIAVKYETRHTSSPPRNLAKQAVPAELHAIIAQAIALEPEDRFDSAEQFGDALAEFIRSRTEQAAYSQKQTAARIRRRQFVALVLVGILTSLIGLGAYFGPKRGRAHELVRLAIQDLKEKDYVNASERLEQAYKLEPHRELMAWQGWCYANMGKYTNAKYCFEQAQPDEDQTGTLWHNIGCCYEQTAARQKAIDCFSKSLEQNPSDKLTHWRRAMGRLRYAQVTRTPLAKEAIADIEFVLKLDEGDKPYLYFEAASIFAYANDSRCEEFIRKALLAGVSKQEFKRGGFAAFDLKAMTPVALPSEVRGPELIDAFRPLPVDLQEILANLP